MRRLRRFDIKNKSYVSESGIRAVNNHLQRSFLPALVESSVVFPVIYRIRYGLYEYPLISVITFDDKSSNIIIMSTLYKNYEIIRADRFIGNNKTEQINHAAKVANGKYIVIVRSGITKTSPEWLDEMLMYAQRKEVGAVGAKIVTQFNTIYHAGYILGAGKNGVVGSALYGLNNKNPGYMGRLCYSQNLSAVSSAGFMIRKELFAKFNGFNSALDKKYSDVDLCLKLRKEGYLIVWTPHATIKIKNALYIPSEKSFEKEAELFVKQWQKVIEKGDPYYNTNFKLGLNIFKVRIDRKKM